MKFMKIDVKERNTGWNTSIFLIAGAAILSGCTSSRQSATAQALAESSPGMIVEGYIEFPGPSGGWAGPQSLVVHLSTWESKAPEITTTPSLVGDENKALTGKLSVEELREDLARLKKELDSPLAAVPSCLSPIRVRLIQADGALFEKEGCRGQKGWPRIASEIAHEVIEDKVTAYNSGNKSQSEKSDENHAGKHDDNHAEKHAEKTTEKTVEKSAEKSAE